jgi:hypothetical protein
MVVDLHPMFVDLYPNIWDLYPIFVDLYPIFVDLYPMVVDLYPMVVDLYPNIVDPENRNSAMRRRVVKKNDMVSGHSIRLVTGAENMAGNSQFNHPGSHRRGI